MKWRKGIKTAAALMAAVFLSGCSGDLPLLSDNTAESGYSMAKIMIVTATERNRYEQIYTGEIWKAEPEPGVTMEDYLLKQIRAFMEDMKTMTMMAEEENIRIEAAEKEKIRQLTEDYYSQLTEDDIVYMGISKEDVQSLYEEYYLANKVVGEVTKEVDLEISDSEAKVISIQQIVTGTREEADQAMERLQAEGADFAAIGKEISQEEGISLQVGRGQLGEACVKAAFSLEEGMISDVIEENGKYYIIKCVNAFEEEATLERKNQLSLARKDRAFREKFESFRVEHPVNSGDEIWDSIHFSPEDKTETTNFFQLYQTYFPEQ